MGEALPDRALPEEEYFAGWSRYRQVDLRFELFEQLVDVRMDTQRVLALRTNRAKSTYVNLCSRRFQVPPRFVADRAFVPTEAEATFLLVGHAFVLSDFGDEAGVHEALRAMNPHPGQLEYRQCEDDKEKNDRARHRFEWAAVRALRRVVTWEDFLVLRVSADRRVFRR